MPASKPNDDFSKVLLNWDRRYNDRRMPWKGENDPYKIWLSEIILQQTRVEQGLRYYESFCSSFPSIRELAAAPDDLVFKCWEGLGYYSRCRNLLTTARQIVRERNGVFPSTYDEIVRLKGIGPYTAAAIASFAYGLPHAVVDGNVFRVLSRVFGIRKPVDSTPGKRYFNTLAQALLDVRQPGRYNQALMDFGATVCKPQVPDCPSCPFQSRCIALQKKQVRNLPVKGKKATLKKRYLQYLVMEYQGSYAIRQRVEKDIWQGLFEFLLLETDVPQTHTSLIQRARTLNWLTAGIRVGTPSIITLEQKLSHQHLCLTFIPIHLKRKPSLPGDVQWVRSSVLGQFAFPRAIRSYLNRSGTVAE